MLPEVENHHRSSGDELRSPAGQGGQIWPKGELNIPQTVDNEHGDDSRGEDPSQVKDHLGGLASPVKEEKGQDAGEEGDCRHDGDGGGGLSGSEGHIRPPPFRSPPGPAGPGGGAETE